MKQPIKIVIAEDETPQRVAFSKQIAAAWHEAKIVATCVDGESAIAAVAKHSPEVLFLDIQMPKKTGLEVAKEISAHTHIVFITAYDEYAVAAFESGAIDYLLKPIENARLNDTIERLRARIGQQSPPNLEALIDQLQARLTPNTEYLNWVTANMGNTTKMISVDDILYFQADQKYTKVVTQSHDAIIRTPLKELIARLDSERFWHTHRSVIVAVDAIDSIQKDELGRSRLYLRNRPESLPISKEFHNKLKAL